MEADVDLRNYADQRQLLKHRDIWIRALEQVTTKAMPPEDEAQPSVEERQLFVRTLNRLIKDVDWKQFHDAGRLSLSRLTAIEYRHAIRDIFGVDLQAGDFLGKDPEGNTGFTNDRDSLTFPLFAMDGFLREAERAVEGFLNFQREPWSQSIELEEAWRLGSDKSTELSDDGLHVVLKERNAPFQLNINTPFSGLFRLEILAHVFEGEPISGMTVVVNGRILDRLVIEGDSDRSYSMELFLDAGSNVVSLGFDPDRAPIIQRIPEPRTVPDVIASRVNSPKINPFPMPKKFAGYVEAQRAWDRMNTVIRGFTEAQRLAQWLLDHDQVDYERHALADGTAASSIADFNTTKVPFNLSAGKVAVFLEIPQAELEKQIAKHNGFSHDEYAKVLKRYKSAWTERNPERVVKRPGKIALDRVDIHSHALKDGDTNPSWLYDLPDLEVIAKLGRRAYGRSLRESELKSLRAIYDQTKADLGSEREALRDALVGLLVSPPFLLHYSPSATFGQATIDHHEIARRLARFLWLSIPDEQLIALADQAQLQNHDVLKRCVDRMIQSPKFDAVVGTFVDQWLNLEPLQVYEDSPKIDVSTVMAMRAEPALLFRHIVREDRPLTDLIEANYTFVNASLAHHYGIDGVNSREMVRVDIANDQRGGLLGMAAVHTVTSTPERTSPVTRGALIVELLLGEHLPPAPASVPELNTENKARTVREELELHRSATQCAGCHRRIDPFGFVLENFDQFGVWRDKERGKPVNASTQLPDGTQINDLTEFRQYLQRVRQDDILRNVSQRLFEFALGRKLSYTDEASMLKILKAVEANENRSTALFHSIVTSDQFLSQLP
jgi:hypothetical protein